MRIDRHHLRDKPRGLGRSAVLAVVFGLVAVTVSTPATGSAVSGTSPAITSVATQTAATTGPALDLVDQTTWVAPNSTATATIGYRGVPAGSTIHPTLYGAVPTRSAFTLTMKGRSLSGPGQELAAHPTRGTSGRITVKFGVEDGTSPVGDTAPPPGERVTLTRPGVYPLVFDLTDSAGTTTTTLVSYVIRLARAPGPAETQTQRPLLVSTVVPFESAPSHADDGTVRIPSTTRAAMRALVDGLSGGNAGPESATTASLAYAITPELVEAFAESTDPTDRQLARSLQDEINGHGVLPMPYVGLDLGSWLTSSQLGGRLDELRIRGVAATTRHLGPVDPTIVDVAGWSAGKNDRVTPKSLAWLEAQGATGVLLRPSDLDPLDESRFPRTLTQRFDVNLPGRATLSGVELDTGLARHFTSEDPTLGVNQLMADLAVLGLDLPSLQRGVVVSPPSGWVPSATFLRAYRNALAGSHPAATTPLIRPTPLNTLFEELPTARAAGDMATGGPPLRRTLQSSDRVSPPKRALIAGLSLATAGVVSLAATLPGGASASNRVVDGFQRQIDVASSAALTTAEAGRRLDVVTAGIDALTSSVKLPAPQTITLTSNTADIPFTIHRGTNGPTVAKLSLDAGQRLIFLDGNEMTVRLSRPTTQVRLRVRVDSPGDTIVRARLTSPDGGIDLGDTRLVIRSTAVSGMGLIITFGSLAFLLVWWARDIVRRRRRRRAAHIPPAQLLDLDLAPDPDLE